MVIGLVVVGVALILLAVWIIRQTRPDLDVLAPLERMGDGDWRKRDPSTQRRMLDEVRPEGAQPLTPEPMAPPIDAEFEQAGHSVSSFSDLGPGVNAELRDPTPYDLDPASAADAGLALEQEASASERDAADVATDDEREAADDEREAADDAGGASAADEADDEADSDEALSDPGG